MTIEEEISAASSFVGDARKDGSMFIQRLIEASTDETTELLEAHRNYVDRSIESAEATVGLCAKLAMASPERTEASTKMIEGLIENVVGLIGKLYLTMSVIDGRVHCTGCGSAEPATVNNGRIDVRKCSFCNTSCERNEVLAGPSVNICRTCARLACGVFGFCREG
jgi:hypothetical protein